MNFLQPGTLRSPLLLLLLLLIGLAALITILNRQDRYADSVWTLQTAETVRKIEIRSDLPNAGGAVTRLTRQGEDWTLSRQVKTEDGDNQDVEAPANADRVAPLLGLLQLPRRDNYHVDEIELLSLIHI